MKLEKEIQLFFGCKIDSKLREALAQAKPGDRRYFEEPDSEFLRICEVGEEKWIGKVVGAGLNVTEVEDIQRNVISILRRIAPEVRKAASTVKIFAIDARVAPMAEVIEPEESGGPYISNY
ncbi:MAG TPA: hypothetical protein VML75_25550 [Kofleriaceae bacterium]|nr:hypothetical protein [Kofleriaceae bacterium]